MRTTPRRRGGPRHRHPAPETAGWAARRELSSQPPGAGAGRCRSGPVRGDVGQPRPVASLDVELADSPSGPAGPAARGTGAANGVDIGREQPIPPREVARDLESAQWQLSTRMEGRQDLLDGGGGPRRRRQQPASRGSGTAADAHRGRRTPAVDSIPFPAASGGGSESGVSPRQAAAQLASATVPNAQTTPAAAAIAKPPHGAPPSPASSPALANRSSESSSSRTGARFHGGSWRTQRAPISKASPGSEMSGARPQGRKKPNQTACPRRPARRTAQRPGQRVSRYGKRSVTR